MTKPWIIGESPSRTGDRFWQWPLSGAPARVLCECAGWPPDGNPRELGSWTWALYERFVTTNVFQRHAAATPWDAAKARARASTIEVDLASMDAACAVLLGRKVGAAFGLSGVDYFEWDTTGLIPRVVIPHPSGRNLLLNEPRNRERIGQTLREAVERHSTALAS